jgi:hypothetical protein
MKIQNEHIIIGVLLLYIIYDYYFKENTEQDIDEEEVIEQEDIDKIINNDTPSLTIPSTQLMAHSKPLIAPSKPFPQLSSEQLQQLRLQLQTHMIDPNPNTKSYDLHENMNGSMNQSMNGSMNQSMNGSMNQSINRSMNQSMHGSTYGSMHDSLNNSVYNGYDMNDSDIKTPEAMQRAYFGPNGGGTNISGNQLDGGTNDMATFYELSNSPVNIYAQDYKVRATGLDRSLDGSFFKHSRLE